MGLRWLGQLNYYRGKGQSWVEMIRSWITPAAMGGGFAKFLGVENTTAIGIAIALPVIVETFGTLWGRFLYHRGAVQADYELAMLMDPYKVKQIAFQDESLAAFKAMAALLAKIESRQAEHLAWLQEFVLSEAIRLAEMDDEGYEDPP